MGKLIVIEGTDCSGKETQSNILYEKLKQSGEKVFKTTYPRYDTPTGKIVGGAYLGKPDIGKSFFEEGATHVDSLVASSLYAADRRYNMKEVSDYLEKDYTVIIDRYVESNMAHQGAKIEKYEDRIDLYNKLRILEYELMELPKPDVVIFLYMPFEFASILKKNRGENLDDHEKDLEYLKTAERVYLELTELMNFKQINCTYNKKIKSVEEISDEVYEFTKTII